MQKNKFVFIDIIQVVKYYFYLDLKFVKIFHLIKYILLFVYISLITCK